MDQQPEAERLALLDEIASILRRIGGDPADVKKWLSSLDLALLHQMKSAAIAAEAAADAQKQNRAVSQAIIQKLWESTTLK